MSARQPIEVSDLDIAFGGKAMQILPPMTEIPTEFHTGESPWCKWQREWFFEGLKSVPAAKDGIDQRMAIRCLAVVQGSFAPKHEHKEAGVAYLASLWLELPEAAS